MPSSTMSLSRTLLGLLVMSACLPSDPPLTDAERQVISASVDSATRAFEAAERARDPERVIAHLAPNFYMYNDGVRSGYDSTAASIRGTLGSFQHFEPGFADVEVTALGRNAALVSFTFHDSLVTGSGDLLQFQGPTTLIWERRGADWLIVYADADHYPGSPQTMRNP